MILKAQTEWADKKITRVMAGIDQLIKFPVTILNTKFLIECVRGVEDEEVAAFVFNMTNCNQFELIAVPYPHFCRLDIITRFDGRDDSSKVAYGKWK
jgi:hypothetical protein